jgi:hypothetical protein
MCNSCFELAELVHNDEYRPNPMIEKVVFEALEKIPFADEIDKHDKAVFLICLGAYHLNWIKKEVENG